jgi:hypothetical protein
MPDPVSLSDLLRAVQQPLWQRLDFWISTVLGIVGVVLSGLAFVEARNARKAATEAGRTVKIQTTAIELMEVVQKLERIRQGTPFNEARDMLNEVSRRVRRATAPFSEDVAFKVPIGNVRAALEAAKKALADVRPVDSDAELQAPQAVYLGVEAQFSAIGDYLAELLGYFEKETLDLGAHDGN